MFTASSGGCGRPGALTLRLCLVSCVQEKRRTKVKGHSRGRAGQGLHPPQPRKQVGQRRRRGGACITWYACITCTGCGVRRECASTHRPLCTAVAAPPAAEQKEVADLKHRVRRRVPAVVGDGARSPTVPLVLAAAGAISPHRTTGGGVSKAKEAVGGAWAVCTRTHRVGTLPC